MRNIVANTIPLILLILAVNANEKLDLKTGANPNNENSRQYVDSLIKGDSENSAKPQLGMIQKPMLLKSVAKSETEETPMKHIKLLPESENVSKHDSPQHQVTSANDNTHNEAVSPSLSPLQNDTTLAIDHTTRNSSNQPNAHSKNPIINEYNENASLSISANSESSNNHLKIPEAHDGNSADSSEEIAITPFNTEIITDIITSMLLGSTESYTDVYPEDVVGVVLIGDENIDGPAGSTTNQPEEPETSTGLFSQTIIEPLLEAITIMENMDETTAPSTHPRNTTSWPIEKFDFLVYDEHSHVPCILLSMDVTLRITYETKDQKYITADYKIPDKVIVGGHCGNQNSLTLSWDKNPITGKSSISFNFSKDSSSFYVDSVHIDIALDSHDFPNAKDTFIRGFSSTNLKLFSAPVHNGIHICLNETKVECGSIVATISNVTVIAYNKYSELTDRKVEHCRIIKSRSLKEVNVAAIIGGILGLLIALAVIGTLFSWYRRRRDNTLRFE